MIVTERISEVHNEDCMIGMARYPDKYFDLAVVDPPYGININMNMGRRKGQPKAHDDKGWDNATPDGSYFEELFRVSKFQIIWGGNYFDLPITSSWIFWNKCVPEGVSFADGELAWTSGEKTLRMATIAYSGFNGSEGKIHPTQKPVALYDWIYKNYLPQGGKVIDTHLGSGSNRIAANKAGNIDFVGFELDRDYYEAQEKRWKGFIAQTRLF